MAIKRNDPCPCGSGKKYKKCCLQKESLVQLQDVKEERFLQMKHSLVIQVKDFLSKKVPTKQYYQLQAEFNKRTRHVLDKNIETRYFEFWLFFFHRFENGLRGIEWFVKENGQLLANDEAQMATTWQTLSPKMVQAINKEENFILFEDVFTNEQYPVPNIKDNVPGFAPWYGTFTLIESFQDLFYFNGVRVFEDPNGINRGIKKVQELVEKTNQLHEQVMLDFFPEILAALVTDDSSDQDKTREIKQYTLQYRVVDEQPFTEVIHNDARFAIDTWDDTKKLCSWVGSWSQYTDNEISGSIYLAEVFGTISIENDLLQFNSLDKKRVNEFKQLIQHLLTSDSLVSIDEKINSLSIPYHAEIRDMMVTFDKGIPQYFALYAQNDVRFQFDKPLRQFNGLSINDLIEAERKTEAENWLKQLEYNMYLQVRQQFTNVTTTADYNTVRKQLGLPLSPFVTGGDKRESTFNTFSVQQEAHTEDLSFYEQLGFTQETINHFYAADLVAFFKEKTNGKSENTVRKYRNSLDDLREILSRSNKTSWEECDEVFWTSVFAKDFTSLYEILTKTVIKDFISTTKALAKWLDQQKKTSSLSKVVVKVAKEHEEKLIRSVEMVNA